MEATNQGASQNTAQNETTGLDQKQRKVRVLSYKVFLVTVGSQSYLVRGAKTEARAKKAALDELPVTAKLLESCDLLDLLRNGVLPPEITVSVDEVSETEEQTGQEIQTQEAHVQDLVQVSQPMAIEVPAEAFADDQDFCGRSGHGQFDGYDGHDTQGREFA
ncbi:hypothetical protein [Ferrovum myxofaciens]|uniref:Uncharacterized protein n=1 Tax=Ferrovum myxofaciens TaxID=416213 RepID=A0A9E6SY53_9PROT|nr:hypothetical protein [Ferrovum myxofaciens]QKE37440.1 MAG: hypothetical protein HO273_00750 [Ferrovum myxofaciens]QWY75089.1 MAG: hypothetical protein JVY19_01170 [Ferrovum myxofaciens]QWY77825.1 MAG: hypothetical protein JZL65_01680 [Ferrovum myxofaciens]